MKNLVLIIFLLLSVVNIQGQNKEREDSLIDYPMIIFIDAQLSMRHIIGFIEFEDSLYNKKISFQYYCGAISIKKKDREYLRQISYSSAHIHMVFKYTFFTTTKIKIPHIEKIYDIQLTYNDLISHPVIMIINDKYYDKYYYDVYTGHISKMMIIDNKKDRKLMEKSRKIISE